MIFRTAIAAIVVLAGAACGSPTGKSGSNSDGQTNVGPTNNVAADTGLPAEVSGGFVTGDLYVIIDVYSTNCGAFGSCELDDPDAPILTDIAVVTYTDGMQPFFGADVTIRADGQELPDRSFHPMPERLEFDIETDDMGSILDLTYDTSLLPAHTITAPTEGAELLVGQPVTVTWTPNDPNLRFQVDLDSQPRDATYTGGDSGEYVIEGQWVEEANPEELLQVGRRSIRAIDGAGKGGFVHTHTVRMPVSVVP